MKRTLLLALGLALAAGLFISTADAAPEPMHIAGSSYSFQSVEQDGHIQNDTGCAWDPDDNVAVWAQGYLEGGFQIATCVIADVSHLLGIDFRAPAARPFAATVTMESATGTHTLSWPSVRDGKYQRVKACLTTPTYDTGFTGYESIGGGTGVATSILWIMQTDRRANDAVMTTQLLPNHGGHQATLCGTFYPGPYAWPHCEGDPFVDGRVCYQ